MSVLEGLKKYRAYLIALAVVLMIEILIFNGASLSSLANRPFTPEFERNLSADEEGEYLELTASDIKEEIGNLYFDLDLTEPQLPLRMDLYLSDEGNFYEYRAGQTVFVRGLKAGRYLTVHPYGRVSSLRAVFRADDRAGAYPEQTGAAFLDKTVRGITANAKRPLFFNAGRVVILYLIFLLFYGLRRNGGRETELCRFDRRQRLIAGATVLLLILFTYFLTSSHVLFEETARPHHQQYKELAHALKEGQVALPGEASEGLLKAENPYDTIFLQANGIDYRADYAYYKGRYYVYFGIVPEILVYYPYYLLTGKDFPNHAAVFLFFSGFAAGVFFLNAQLIRRYFKLIPYAAYLILSAATVLSPPFAYLAFTADLYSVPITAGLMFAVWAPALWLFGLMCEKPGRAALFYALGSLSFALIAGSRPQLLLFGLIAIPIFFKEVITERKLFAFGKKETKEGVLQSVFLVLPVILTAAFVMWYNASRFGSPFDFGATYSLTNNDMNTRGFNLSRTIGGLVTFLFSLPKTGGEFPFLSSSDLQLETAGYMGRTVTEFLFGGVIISNVLTLVLILLPRFRNELRKTKLFAAAVLMLVSSAVIGMADANTAGLLQRYSADMTFGILFATTLMYFLLAEYFRVEFETVTVTGRSFAPLDVLMNFLKLGFVIQLFYALCVIGNTESGITLITYNPELFYRIRQAFMILQ
ncbi:MAG: hypothetical protein K6F53_06345 [Lachnospiraceae bacterium]|nr:hypothetical protein [Lachnospiraceae bacterium]